MKSINGLKSSDLVFSILICVVIMVFDRLGVINPLYSFLSSSFNSVQEQSSQFFHTLEQDLSFIANIALITEELETTKKELEFYKVENERLTRDVADLSKILEQEYFDLPFSTLPARVLFYTPGQAKIVINKGESQNVKIGSAVIINDVLVGKVEKTYHNSSEVQLVTHPSLKIPSVIEVDNLRGFVGGDGAGKIQISDIPNTNIITLGSIVFSSGADNQIPYGLLIGRVEVMTSNQTDLVQTATIEPLIRLNQLSDVFVVIQ